MIITQKTYVVNTFLGRFKISFVNFYLKRCEMADIRQKRFDTSIAFFLFL